MNEIANRNRRKVLVGVVVSKLGDKSVKVAYDYGARHPLYRKEVKRQTIVYVHDEANACHIGSQVKIMETRPLSKLKRWRLLEVMHQGASKEGKDSHVAA